MAKYLKLFERHTDYEDYIASDEAIRPNVSVCKDELNIAHFNPQASITLAINLSQAGKERISHIGDFSSLGFSSNDDGLSNVYSVIIDGNVIDIENDLTVEKVFDYQGIVINAYFYNFTTSGEHTIIYVLKAPVLKSLMTVAIGTTDFKGMTFPSGMTSMDCTMSNVQSIESYGVSYCGITSVEIPNDVTSISEGTFASCSSLTSITIPNSVTSIGNSAFSICSSLTSITIPNSVTSIGNYAFYFCPRLTSITIPNSVTSIGEHAFYYCGNLTNVTVLAITPPTLGDSVFIGNASGRKIYVPAESVDTYKAASGWSEYANDIVAIS